jgi:hypothetical protein
MKTVWENFTNGFLESFAATWTQASAEAGTGEDGIKSLSDAMKSLGEVLGGLAGPMRDTMEFFKDLGPVFTAVGVAVTTVFAAVKSFVSGLVYTASALGESVNDLLHGRVGKVKENFKLAAKMAGEADEEGANSILAAAGFSSYAHRLPQGMRPGLKGPEGTVADFGGGKKHKKKGGKGGTYGDFMGGDWDISEGGAWAPGAGGAAPWGSAAASDAVTPSVASVDAYPSQVARSVAAASSPSTVTVEHVDIHIEGARMSGEEIGDAVANALRGIGRHARNPSPASL